MQLSSRKIQTIAEKIATQIEGQQLSEDAYDVMDLLEDCALYLEERGRLDLFPEIVGELKRKIKSNSLKNEVVVVSAVELDKDQKSLIVKKVQKRFGEDTSVHVEIDRSIIGGIIVRYHDLEIDLSVRNKIQSIKSKK